MAEFPPIEVLAPHAAPMLLLDRLVGAGPDHAVCELEVRADGLFDRDGQVPCYLGLEYMAQAVATWSGYQSHLRNQPARLGFLLGTRRFESNVEGVDCGRVLRVSVRCEMQDKSGLASFECLVESIDGKTKVDQSARLSVYEPVDAQRFLDGGET